MVKNKDIKVKYEMTQEELKNKPDKAKENFLKNLEDNEELRLEFWNKLYGRKFVKATGRKDLTKIKEAEQEWNNMDTETKNQWFDYITDDGKALGVVGELNFIVQLLKIHKGNMKKVWVDLRNYGNSKKEDNENEL